MTLAAIAPLLAQWLAPLGDEALNYVLAEGGEYLKTLLRGGELTVEERDEFYLVIDKSSRMEFSNNVSQKYE